MGEESLMGGGPIYPVSNFSVGQSALMNQTADQINSQLAAQAMADVWRDEWAKERKERKAASVPKTAASRVQKADWEMEYDRKEREVEEMIERQRQERERVRIEEESGND